jgi:hypothetical protein
MKLSGEIEAKVKEAILLASTDKRISCSKARKIAKDFGVPVRYVGDLINELGIKIYACELGCF